MEEDIPQDAAEAVEDTPPAIATEVAAHVEDAASGATEAAAATGQEGWKEVASELKGLRSDIKKLLKAPASAAPASQDAPAPAPDVEVEVPTPPERKIRRGGRKVVRRG